MTEKLVAEFYEARRLNGRYCVVKVTAVETHGSYTDASKAAERYNKNTEEDRDADRG